MKNIRHSLTSLSVLVGILVALPTMGVIALGQGQTQSEETPPERPIYGIRLPKPAPGQMDQSSYGEAQFPKLMPVEFSKVVFQSLRDDDWEIYRLNGDGTDSRLTYQAGVDVEPRFDRGCHNIVFTSNRSGSYNLYRMNADGGDVVQLTTHGDSEINPAWSPNGAQIVFQSNQVRVGGVKQYDIFMINADGTGQLRLTTDGDYDGEPAWSPEGDRLAFVSRRTGGYRVYTMNTDGSGLVQLSNQPYSSFPAWDPDNRQIAYSADGNGDGWLEMWLMDADGSDQHMVYASTMANSDVYMRSWSPDGRYLAFTEVAYVEIDGDWYWYDSAMVYLDVTSGYVAGDLEHTLYDWYPDWRSIDDQSPISSIHTLPVTSAAPLHLEWSGVDIGPAGIRGYDVQVKTGLDGAWMEWLGLTKLTAADYPIIGGQTYFFRIRAVDKGGNLEPWPATPDTYTLIEGLAPQSSVSSLAEYSRNGLSICWGGDDPGGSGITDYDVQYKEGNGEWLDWFSRVQVTCAPFWGQAGGDYQFRVRAVDAAHNQETWPMGQADTSTTLVTWGIDGHAEDIGGGPVSGISVNIFPAAAYSSNNSQGGFYGVYGLTETSWVTATWGKAGYGQLPDTRLSPPIEPSVDIALPPVVNHVASGDFEGTADQFWQSGGLASMTFGDASRHTGLKGVRLGNRQAGFGSPQDIGTGQYPVLTLDSHGGLHAAWSGGVYDQSDIFYAYRDLGGIWSPARNISNSPEINSSNPTIIVSPSGLVHVLWIEANFFAHEQSGSYMATFTPGIGWSAPNRVSTMTYNDSPGVVTGTDGLVHVVWSVAMDGYLYYFTIDDEGRLSPESAIEENLRGYDPILAWDASGKLHLVFQGFVNLDGGSEVREVRYAIRAANGVWSTPNNITSQSGGSLGSTYPQMGLDEGGTVHISWYSPYGYESKYTWRSPDGTWGPEIDMPSPPYVQTEMAVGVDGRVHAFWISQGVFPALQYASWNGSSWSPTEDIYAPSDNFAWYPLVVKLDPSGNPHCTWTAGYPFLNVYYSKRDSTGNWSAYQQLSTSSDLSEGNQRMVLDASGSAHIVWSNGSIQYAGPPLAETTGVFTISQNIGLPEDLESPVLSFLSRLDGFTQGSGSIFSASIQDETGSTITLYSTDASWPGWQHQRHTLSAWAGETFTLTFTLQQAEGHTAPLVDLDEIAIGQAYPGLWVGLSARQSLEPGSQAQLNVMYGNEGGAPAAGTQLTLTLPIGWSFISASITPTLTGPEIVWSLADLQPWYGTNTIEIMIQTPEGVSGSDTARIEASIASSSVELELSDNHSTTDVWVGYRLYLPGVARLG